MESDTIRRLARECGFELAGVAAAEPIEDDVERYQKWAARGMAGEMQYLTDRRAEVRRDPRNLLPGARSIICVGKLYNQSPPPERNGHAIFARYAWGRDYHDVLRESLEQLAHKLAAIEQHRWKICVDTAPLLERSYARQAGLGWIGRNTCLINEPLGSWFFLGELITTLELEPDAPPPDRCGTCARCIEACPTQAIVPEGDGWTLDARRCISYLNIELRGPIPEEQQTWLGARVFGCDICQDVCPWNTRAPETNDPAFRPRYDVAPRLEELATLSAEEFRERFRGTPVMRAKYDGMVRNVAAAMGATAPELESAEVSE
ncbi:MAG: tRNA epoxyqueuosine(34) reductase QueG [Acidobacteriota bacterium]